MISSNGQKTICVYCSSSEALAPHYYAAAAELGRLMAERGDRLTYGGGKIGLMGALARAIHEHGGTVTGVIPERLMAQLYDDVDELIVTQDLRERKAILEEQADAFVALPGGFGTLEEVLEIITLKQLQFHQKPIVLMNTSNFYARLMHLFEHLFNEKFAKVETQSQLYHVAETPEDVLRYIDNYRPGEFATKWFDAKDD